jgi:hypothetical protein
MGAINEPDPSPPIDLKDIPDLKDLFELKAAKLLHVAHRNLSFALSLVPKGS